MKSWLKLIAWLVVLKIVFGPCKGCGCYFRVRPPDTIRTELISPAKPSIDAEIRTTQTGRGFPKSLELRARALEANAWSNASIRRTNG